MYAILMLCLNWDLWKKFAKRIVWTSTLWTQQVIRYQWKTWRSLIAMISLQLKDLNNYILKMNFMEHLCSVGGLILKGMTINFVMVRMIIRFYQKVVELVEHVWLTASLSAGLLISIKKSKNQKIFRTKQLWNYGCQTSRNGRENPAFN
jgi:hypothetical protein